MNNGPGLRTVLFVSGCSHKCKGCQNPQTWNKDSGIEFDENAILEVMEDLKEDWCDGITLTGGDPLAYCNRCVIAQLVFRLKQQYPDKSILLYTGWAYEELNRQKKEEAQLDLILKHIDILIDGKFILERLSPGKPWVGSDNQRVIDMKKTLKEGEIILWK